MYAAPPKTDPSPSLAMLLPKANLPCTCCVGVLRTCRARAVWGVVWGKWGCSVRAVDRIFSARARERAWGESEADGRGRTTGYGAGRRGYQATAPEQTSSKFLIRMFMEFFCRTDPVSSIANPAISGRRAARGTRHRIAPTGFSVSAGEAWRLVLTYRSWQHACPDGVAVWAHAHLRPRVCTRRSGLFATAHRLA